MSNIERSEPQDSPLVRLLKNLKKDLQTTYPNMPITAPQIDKYQEPELPTAKQETIDVEHEEVAPKQISSGD